MMRLSVTSVYSIGSAPSVLSIVSETSARPSGGRPEVPAKMTSSIFPPRKLLGPCSPITQASASTTLDLPEPFGPTTQVMPGSRRSVVADANDLKPRRVRDFRYTCPLLPRNNPAERPSLEGYRPGRATAGKRAATRDPGPAALPASLGWTDAVIVALGLVSGWRRHCVRFVCAFSSSGVIVFRW